MMLLYKAAIVDCYFIYIARGMLHMVMYEDNVKKGELILVYENTPGANQVVYDILNAPIESVSTFQNKRKNQIVVTDKYITVGVKLGKKAEEQVIQEVIKARPKWKVEKEQKDFISFKLSEEAESEQAILMRG